MPDRLFEIKLKGISVVILAEVHNPAIVNVDFLKGQSIVSKEWEVVPNTSSPSITTPTFSIVSFTNGVQLDVNPQLCTFRENVKGGLQESYSILGCAKKYVETLPHIPYLGIGINWHISLDFQRDPAEWFKNHFFKQDELINRLTPTSFAFKIEPNCNLTLNMQNVFVQDKKIELACNFHTDISSKDIKSITSAIDKYKQNQESLQGYLKTYLEGDLS